MGGAGICAVNPTNGDLGAMLKLVETNGRTSGTGLKWPTGGHPGRLAISASGLGTSRGVMLFCAADFARAVTVETDTGSRESLQMVVDPDDPSLVWAPYLPAADTQPAFVHVETADGQRAHRLTGMTSL